MEFIFTERAQQQFDRLPRADQRRITLKMRFFAHQNNPMLFAKHLVDLNAYRFRIGDFRVIFDLEKNVIFVLAIVRRDRAYRNL